LAKGNKVEVDQRSLDEILETLKKIDNLAQKQINAASRLGAKYVQKKAKEKAPVSADGSHGRPKGFLKKNIKIKAEKSKTKGKKTYSVGVSGDAYYGVFIEYGSKRNAAKPFLRPALDENRDELTRIILGEVAKGVDQAK
jgi:HK97 gp10 family phage protein